MRRGWRSRQLIHRFVSFPRSSLSCLWTLFNSAVFSSSALFIIMQATSWAVSCRDIWRKLEPLPPTHPYYGFKRSTKRQWKFRHKHLKSVFEVANYCGSLSQDAVPAERKHCCCKHIHGLSLSWCWCTSDNESLLFQNTLTPYTKQTQPVSLLQACLVLTSMKLCGLGENMEGQS